MTEAETRRPDVAPEVAPLVARLRGLASHVSVFVLVGVVAFAVDLLVYNVLRASVLEGSPIGAKVGAAAVSMTVAWLGNRWFTFRGRSSGGVVREAVLFLVINLCGLAIAAGCLFVSHYLLGYTSQLADNISGNGIGLVLATAFRYAAYRTIVFR